jgi:REP element-mobilizing transposase RayT
MSRYLKYHPNGNVLFITSSIEEGLLFLCNPLCTAILKSCLSAALAKYPVRLCHFVIEPTHIHIIIVVENPEDVPEFMKYFKCETAHRINRVLGRRKRTVWCEGYDSPIVLTPLRALVAISYLYSNPAKDSLTYNIDEYEGVSRWNMFSKGEHSEENKIIPRDEFEIQIRLDSVPLTRFTPSERRY